MAHIYRFHHLQLVTRTIITTKDGILYLCKPWLITGTVFLTFNMLGGQVVYMSSGA